MRGLLLGTEEVLDDARERVPVRGRLLELLLAGDELFRLRWDGGPRGITSPELNTVIDQTGVSGTDAGAREEADREAERDENQRTTHERSLPDTPALECGKTVSRL